MLSLTTTNKITFNVNVFGTASTPVVRCVLGDAPGYSFPATKLADGKYEVLMDLPKDLRLGAHQFKVEVLLNGRLFTPINHSVAVTGPEAGDTTPSVPTEPAAATPATAIELVKSVAAVNPPIGVAAVAAVAEKVEPAKVKVEPLSGLKKIANAIVPKRVAPAHVTETKISMSEIQKLAERRMPESARVVAPVMKIKESISPSIPVSLVKGAVIYR